MNFLKNLGIIILFIFGGIGLGVSVFYIQKNYFQPTITQPTSQTETTTKTVALTNSVPTTNSYTNTDLGFSFPLPTNGYVYPEEKKELSALALNILIKQGDNSLQPSGLIVYVLEKDTTASTAYKAALKKKVVTGYQLNASTSTFNTTSSTYTNSNGEQLELTEIEGANGYFILTNVPLNASTAISSDTISSIVSALSSTSPTASPSSSPSSSPLLDSSNE